MEHKGSMRVYSVIILASIARVLATTGPYCGSASMEPFIDRIVGGVEVSPHEFPWMVKLSKKNVGFECGATLIADKYLLTAGHCLVHVEKSASGVINESQGLTLLKFERLPAEDFSVELGTHEVNETEPFTKSVLQYHLHPQFNFYFMNGEEFPVNDIAILKMDPIDFNYYTLPICLPPDGKILPDNVKLVMAGWGNLKGNAGHTITDVPMKTSFIKLPAESCKKNPKVGQLVNAVDQLSLRQAFCLTSDVSSTCRGDSGGPVFVYTYNGFELVGVISTNFGCGVPGYCTQVSMYIEFIKDNTLDGVYLTREEPKLVRQQTLF